MREGDKYAACRPVQVMLPRTARYDSGLTRSGSAGFPAPRGTQCSTAADSNTCLWEKQRNKWYVLAGVGACLHERGCEGQYAIRGI